MGGRGIRTSEGRLKNLKKMCNRVEKGDSSAIWMVGGEENCWELVLNRRQIMKVKSHPPSHMEF